MANQVQVDELDIARRFEMLELEGEAADDAVETAHLEATHDPKSWMRGAAAVVDIVDAKLCPNWELGVDEKRDLTEVLAKCLDHYLPGAIDGIDNWHPLLQLAFAGGAIAVQRIDWKRGGFVPLHPPKEGDDDDDSGPAGWPPDGSDRGEPDGENGLRFTASS